MVVSKSKKSIDLAQPKQVEGREPITPADVHQTESVPISEAQASSSHPTETPSDSKRKELGFEDSLKDIPGVTDRMIVAFGEHGITSIEDLAACATDDLDGWSESKDGKTIRHEGILDRLGLSREDCEALIMNARIKAGWIT
jgi:predicted flap endonuclease-1-like 5' DNA nuclease